MKMNDENLLLAEYKRYAESFWKNEEVGEKRVSFFITLVTAILAALVALLTSKDASLEQESIRQIVIGTMIGVLIFGILIFLRILRRDRVTDEYKKILDYIRETYKNSSNLDEYNLPFQPPQKMLFQGGLAFLVAAINSFVFACFIYLLCVWYSDTIEKLPAVIAKPIAIKQLSAITVFMLGMLVQGLIIMQRKKK